MEGKLHMDGIKNVCGVDQDGWDWIGGNRKASSGAEDKDRSLPGLGWECVSWYPEDRSGMNKKGGWKTAGLSRSIRLKLCPQFCRQWESGRSLSRQ